MFKTIVIKEIRDITKSKKFLMSFLAAALLIILSFYVGGRWYQLNQQRYEAALAGNLRQMEGITDWIMVKHHIFLPPQPLAALVNGVDNDIGRNIEMFGQGELESSDSRFSGDPVFAMFRFLDIEFIFSVVLALFAIMFGYNAVNGEKEAGTLRLVFANAVPKAHFILGKMTGVLLTVIIPLLLPILVGCLVLMVMRIPMKVDDWFRLSLIVTAGILYFSVFLLLSIFLSAVTKNSSTSFLFALLVWIFATLVIPRAAVLLAGRAANVPGVDEIAAQKFSFRSQLWAEDIQKMNRFTPPRTGNPQEMMDAFQQFMGDLSRERNEKIMAYATRGI